MISTNSLKILSATSKTDLNNDRKRVSENNNAIINEEISSEEKFDNQDLSQGLKMENKSSDVTVLYNGRPQTRELGQKSLSMKTKMDPADIYGSGDIILYDNGLQRREEDQDQSNDMKLGLELTPDEQSERVNLLLLGFASIILMNAMAVLIITLMKVSKFEDQLVIKSNIMKKQIKGKYVIDDSRLLSKMREWL